MSADLSTETTEAWRLNGINNLKELMESNSWYSKNTLSNGRWIKDIVRYADYPTLMEEIKEELKSLLMKA